MNEKIAAISRLQPGWDSYGAPAISAKAVEVADSLVRFLHEIGAEEPAVVPTSGGGIQLEWHQGDFDVEINVRPNGWAAISIEDVSIEHGVL